MYLHTKFDVSSIILTTFRKGEGVILPLPPPPPRRKNGHKINIQEICMIVFYKIKLTFQIPDSRPKSQYKVSLNFPFVTPVIPNAEADFTEITLWHRCSPVNLLHIFRTPFLKDTSE